MYREKLLQFINSILPVGYEDRDVRIRNILINPVVKQAGLLPLLEKFKQNTALHRLIIDRTELTHRLHYGVKFDFYFRPVSEKKTDKPELFKKWVGEWEKEIKLRAKRTMKSEQTISIINHSLAQKIVAYKKSVR